MTPIEIVIVTIASLIVLKYIIEKVTSWYKTGFKIIIFRLACKLPYIRTKVAGEF